jgi:hypothetical protein
MMEKMAKIIILTKRLYTLDDYRGFLEKHYHLKIKKAYLTSNREQNNIFEQIDLTTATIMNALANNQTFCCEFILDNRFEAGYCIKLGENNIYEITLWLNTCCVPYIRFESMNRNNIEYYSHPISMVTGVIHKEDLILAGMGLDPIIQYNESIDKMIDESSGIFIWIAPNVISSFTSSQYDVKNKDNFLIYIEHVQKDRVG